LRADNVITEEGRGQEAVRGEGDFNPNCDCSGIFINDSGWWEGSEIDGKVSDANGTE